MITPKYYFIDYFLNLKNSGGLNYLFFPSSIVCFLIALVAEACKRSSATVVALSLGWLCVIGYVLVQGQVFYPATLAPKGVIRYDGFMSEILVTIEAILAFIAIAITLSFPTYCLRFVVRRQKQERLSGWLILAALLITLISTETIRYDIRAVTNLIPMVRSGLLQ